MRFSALTITLTVAVLMTSCKFAYADGLLGELADDILDDDLLEATNLDDILDLDLNLLKRRMFDPEINGVTYRNSARFNKRRLREKISKIKPRAVKKGDEADEDEKDEEEGNEKERNEKERNENEPDEEEADEA